MTALSRFARLLGLPAHQAEDALRSERAARHVLTRRGFFGVSAAMVAGTAFSFAPPPPTFPCLVSGGVYSWADVKITINGKDLLADVVSIEYARPSHDRAWPRNFVRNAGQITYSAVLERDSK